MKKVVKLKEEEYQEICLQLGINPATDLNATNIASLKIQDKNVKEDIKKLRRLVKGKKAYIFGAGPSLENAMNKFLPIINQSRTENVIFAVDGATKALIEKGIKIDVVVTDLDGSLPAIYKSFDLGAIIIIHAHGDNIAKIEEVSALIAKPNVIITTQTKETGKVSNFGGFTDGDRAAYIAANFNAKSILLIAFDFGNIIGRYSKPENHLVNFQASNRKLIKFKIAKELLAKLPENFPKLKIYNLTDKGEKIENIPHVEYKEFITLLKNGKL